MPRAIGIFCNCLKQVTITSPFIPDPGCDKCKGTGVCRMAKEPGKAIKASELPPATQQALEDMKDQLIICLIELCGGAVVVPVSDIDTVPVGKTMTMVISEDNKEFLFKVKRMT